MSARLLPNFKEWTLFLDRDGVINKRLPDLYVATLEQFDFLAGVPGTLKTLADKFGRIIIVTNQQGIGKGLMTRKDLAVIHDFLVERVELAGGRIDAIYFAPELAQDNSMDRKPNIGMALQAQRDFPEIDFNKSIMVGDSESDMQFGRNANMITIYLGREANPKCVDFFINGFSELSSDELLMKVGAFSREV